VGAFILTAPHSGPILFLGNLTEPLPRRLIVPTRRCLAFILALASWLLVTGASRTSAQGTEQTPAQSKPPAVEQKKPVAATPGEIKVESIPATRILYLAMKGSYKQTAGAIGQVLGYAQTRGITGGPFGIYYNVPTEVPVDSLKWDIAVPVSDTTKAEPPLQIKTLPEMQAATTICTGPYAGSATCWGAVSNWIKENGYVMAGAPQEHWLSDASTPPDSLQSRIVFPVEKQEAPEK
jgi:effector-binding domain-containing protein